MMNDFTLFSEKPCETFNDLKIKGVPVNSDYMVKLQYACDQKMQPASIAGNKNTVKIIGISTAALAFIVGLILIIKKKKK
jgi:hypothetical protein